MSNITVKKILSEVGFQANAIADIIKGSTPEARDLRKIFVKMIKSELKSAKVN
jgi:hypothetical protein